MKRLPALLKTVLVVGMILWPRRDAWADGGQLCASEQIGTWSVSVFASRALWGEGTTDFSVFVADATGRPAGQEIDVVLESRHPATGALVRCLATSEAATNKLFRTAICPLAYPGTWHVTATLLEKQQSRGALDFDLHLRPGMPSWFDRACWAGWPVVPIALFSLHQLRKGKKGSLRRRQAV